MWIFQSCSWNRQETGIKSKYSPVVFLIKKMFYLGARSQNIRRECLLAVLVFVHSSPFSVVNTPFAWTGWNKQCFSFAVWLWPCHNFWPQLSQRAREIYNSFISSKATTPVNIDSQAQLADDILNAPRPDMFKEQQLQVRQEVGLLHCISE